MLTESPITGAGGQIAALVRWKHRRGRPAHCLARLYPADEKVIAVISELASNPNDLGIANDFAAVATEVLRVAREEIGVDPDQLVWLAHHGAFSVAGAYDPDTFTLIPLTWTGDAYVDDLHTHQVLPASVVNKLLGSFEFRQVPEVVDALQHR